eukprot:5764422-Amphidinium_carterae.1
MAGSGSFICEADGASGPRPYDVVRSVFKSWGWQELPRRFNENVYLTTGDAMKKLHTSDPEDRTQTEIVSKRSQIAKTSCYGFDFLEGQ